MSLLGRARGLGRAEGLEMAAELVAALYSETTSRVTSRRKLLLLLRTLEARADKCRETLP